MIATQIDEHMGAVLRTATMDRTPWKHAYLRETLPENILDELSSTFENIEMTASEESRREKSYRFATARIDGTETLLPNASWHALLAFLHSPSYRSAVADLTGVDLRECTSTVNVWEYAGGDWLAPHVDKPEKVVTQILYFTDGWTEGDGGRLLILKDNHSSSVVRALPPKRGACAVLVRSDSSWHAVEPPASTSAPRRSVTVTFWRTSC